ncbi:PP2C family protein-serine/threonine phosphatase [Amycolatopsis sp. GM8]|uniref:PP2C family protein-serine/threonine phosphatase n=1 Tax=Amycolatopsis sp. GM8 TaxID=2896530 RepID=UPI001F0115DC|nr:GAF domain-containing SpoIIE family protein phosphatase [Amycolatopsis sp. GM8]
MATEQLTPAPGQVEDTEDARLAAVRRYDILDTPPDGAFDRIALVAARLLGTPIATVSIVDTDRIWFKATTGLAVRQIGRDPGLCSTAILADVPYVVRDALTDPRTVDNPLIQSELGIRFYAAAPIITADGHRLGTVNVLDTKPRGTGPVDTATLADLAAVVMDELELRLSALTTLRKERELRKRSEQDRATITAIAATLRQTLLPPTLPRVPGLELACHYHSATTGDVTGDFYDVLSLGGGRWAFFVGDVAGHGPPAAAVTSLVRYTLRSALFRGLEPAEALAELNDALLRDAHLRECCTLLAGVFTEDTAEITLASGGHCPALWLRDDVTQVWPEGGMLVGALHDATFVTRKLRLEPGQTLLLHTDGLTEARPGGTPFGEDGLLAFLTERKPLGARETVAALIELIDGFVPAPTDDVALLALSRSARRPAL